MKTEVIQERVNGPEEVWEGELPRLCECTQMVTPKGAVVRVHRTVVVLNREPVQRVYVR